MDIGGKETKQVGKGLDIYNCCMITTPAMAKKIRLSADYTWSKGGFWSAHKELSLCRLPDETNIDLSPRERSSFEEFRLSLDGTLKGDI